MNHNPINRVSEKKDIIIHHQWTSEDIYIGSPCCGWWSNNWTISD